MIAAGRKSKMSQIASWSLTRIDLLRARRVDHQRYGVGGADRVRHLQEALVRKSRRHHVLGDVPRHVRTGAVDLRRILPTEGAATVRRHAAIGIDDDLAAREARVGLRTADLEPPGRIHEDPDAIGGELRELAEYRIDHLGLDVRPQEGFDVDLLPVLRADQHGVDPRRPAVHVLDRDLTLAVRTEVGNDPRLADVGQTPGETVREGDRQRHQLVGLMAGVAEHHPLVAGARACRARPGSAPHAPRARAPPRSRCRETAPGSR